MITQFRAQNFKALRDVTLNLTPMHVLIGPNDSGKTSILEAIAAMAWSAFSGNDGSSFGDDWKGQELVWQQKDEPITLAATTGGDQAIRATLTFRFPRSMVVITSEFRLDDEEVDTRSNTSKTLHQKAERFWSSIAPTRSYRWQARYLAMPCASDSSRAYNIDASGFGLAQALDGLATASPESFIELKKLYRELFPSVSDIKLRYANGSKVSSPPQAGVPVVSSQGEGKGIYFSFHGVEGEFRASRVSDGLLFGLALVTVLSTPEPPAIILLEEPENGIHPKLLSHLFDAMRALLAKRPNTQLIMTTHSPYVVDLMKPEEVTLCRKDDATGEIKVTRLSESAPVRDEIDVFTLGEIWTIGDDRDARLMATVPTDADVND